MVSSCEKDDPAAEIGLAAQIALQNKTQSNQGILKKRWQELLVSRIAERLLAALLVGRLNLMYKSDVLTVLGVPWGGR